LFYLFTCRATDASSSQNQTALVALPSDVHFRILGFQTQTIGADFVKFFAAEYSLGASYFLSVFKAARDQFDRFDIHSFSSAAQLYALGLAVTQDEYWLAYFEQDFLGNSHLKLLSYSFGLTAGSVTVRKVTL